MDYSEHTFNIKAARNALAMMKELESKTEMHSIQLDARTKVFAKNEERLENYKSKK